MEEQPDGQLMMPGTEDTETTDGLRASNTTLGLELSELFIRVREIHAQRRVNTAKIDRKEKPDRYRPHDEVHEL